MNNNIEKIFVAMSGGVDSSVAAYLLKQQQYKLIGATMCLGVPDEEGRAACCGPQAVLDARKVCDQLEMPHYVLDFSKYLYEYVVTDFINEYRSGHTPNPCVRCNRYLKFSELWKYAQSLGYQAIATGHYAKTGHYRGKTVLMRNRDIVKDQSYFLYSVPAEVIENIVFPLSELTKEEVRVIAEEAKLHVAHKAESQEICFIPDDNYRHFLQLHGVSDAPGYFTDTKGNVLGKHNGVFNYTIGQRKGLGIAVGSPMYVVKLDVEHNRVVLGMREELAAKGLIAHQINLFVEDFPETCTAKIRYTQKDVPCRVFREGNDLHIRFESPVDAVTPGQSVVLYDGDAVLGGGIIREALA